MSKTSTIGSAKSSMKRKNSIWHALPYIAPHFIIFAVFGIIPIIFGIGLAFTRWNMVGAPKFVGLQNFAKIFDKQTQTTEEWHNADIFRAGKMCGLRMVIGLWCKQPEQKSLCTLPLQ